MLGSFIRGPKPSWELMWALMLPTVAIAALKSGELELRFPLRFLSSVAMVRSVLSKLRRTVKISGAEMRASTPPRA
ncbi:hypothetical protein D3C72_2278670 [compost metagenome]